MTLTEKVQELLSSDISLYRIGKETGVTTSSLVDTKNGKREVGNMQLKTAEKLGAYWDQRFADMTPDAIAFIVKNALIKAGVDDPLMTIEDMGDDGHGNELKQIVAEIELKGDDDPVRFVINPFVNEENTKHNILQDLSFALRDYDNEDEDGYYPTYRDDSEDHELVEPEYMGVSQESSDYLYNLGLKIGKM